MTENNKEVSTIYDADFFDRIGERSHAAAMIVLPLLIKAGIPFKTVFDIGGGTGNWCLAAKKLGAESITLIDGAYVDPTTLVIPHEYFLSRDLAHSFSVPEMADLAICVEVAEHLSPKRAASFVEDLCATSRNILFSAALPFQGGDGHVNEIWPEYWVDLFAQQGYDVYDFIRPAIWKNPQVDWWYRQNLLFFSARPKGKFAPCKVGNHSALQNGDPVTRIHPEGYVWLAYTHRPENFLTSPQRAIQLHSDISKLDPSSEFGYGGEFDSIPRTELLTPNKSHLRAVIVGPGRSGSTALADLLSDHSGMFCLNESHYLPILEARFKAELAPTRELCDSFLSTRFTPDSPIAEANVQRAGKAPANLYTFLDRLSSTEPELTVARFARYITAYFCSIANASILIDKTPDYAHHLKALLSLWPDLRIVLMVRAPGPTALSMRGHNGYRTLAAFGVTSWPELLSTSPEFPKAHANAIPEEIEPYLDIWCARIEAALEIGAQLDPTQFTLLRYEDLCSNPLEEGRRLMRFLGSDPDQAWLSRLAEGYSLRAERKPEALSAATAAALKHERTQELSTLLRYS